VAERGVGEKKATTNQQLSNTAKAFTGIAKNYVETRATQLGNIGTGLTVGGFFNGLRGMVAVENALAKHSTALATFQAAKTAPEWASTFGWGKGFTRNS
jgi:hypothetical protein